MIEKGTKKPNDDINDQPNDPLFPDFIHNNFSTGFKNFSRKEKTTKDRWRINIINSTDANQSCRYLPKVNLQIKSKVYEKKFGIYRSDHQDCVGTRYSHPVFLQCN